MAGVAKLVGESSSKWEIGRVRVQFPVRTFNCVSSRFGGHTKRNQSMFLSHIDVFPPSLSPFLTLSLKSVRKKQTKTSLILKITRCVTKQTTRHPREISHVARASRRLHPLRRPRRPYPDTPG